MKLRKGVVPLILFLIAAAIYVGFTFFGQDRAPLEKPGESIFRQP